MKLVTDNDIVAVVGEPTQGIFRKNVLLTVDS